MHGGSGMKKYIVISLLVILIGTVTGFYFWDKSERENDDNYHCTVDGMINGEWYYGIETTQEELTAYEENNHYQFLGWYANENRSWKHLNQDCYKGKTMYARYFPKEMTVDFIKTTSADIEVESSYSFYDARVIVSKDNRVFSTQFYDINNTLLVETTEELNLGENETIVNVHFINTINWVYETSSGRFINEYAGKYWQDKRTTINFDKYNEQDPFAFSNISLGGSYIFSNDNSVYCTRLSDTFDLTESLNQLINTSQIINVYNTTIGTYFELSDGTLYNLRSDCEESEAFIDEVESLLLAEELKQNNLKNFYVENGTVYQRYISNTNLYEFDIPEEIIPIDETIIDVYGTSSVDGNDTIRVIFVTENGYYGIERTRENSEYQYSKFDGAQEYNIASLFDLSNGETIEHIMVQKDNDVAFGEYFTVVTTSENRVLMFGSTFSSDNFYAPTASETEILDYTSLLNIPSELTIVDIYEIHGIISIYLDNGSFYRIDLRGEPYGLDYETLEDAVLYIEPSMVTYVQTSFTADDNLLEVAEETIGYSDISKLYLDHLLTIEFDGLDQSEDEHHYFFVDNE